jgi:hypothetical protein
MSFWCVKFLIFLSILNRIDAMSMHDSNQSVVTNLTTGVISRAEVETDSTIVDWSSLVIDPQIEPENEWEEKGIPDEKPVNENAMFALLGLKTEANEREIKLGPVIAPTTDYALRPCTSLH